MIGLLRPLYVDPGKHLYRLIFNPEYRRESVLQSKLSKVRRFTDFRVKVGKWELYSASFLSAYREIFGQKIYAFRFDGPAPRILDLGANIGLSVLFFKSLSPASNVIAFKADPKVFEYPKKNVQGNGYTDVEQMMRSVMENCK